MDGKPSHRNKAAFSNLTGSVRIGPERTDQNRVIQNSIAWQTVEMKLSVLIDAIFKLSINF